MEQKREKSMQTPSAFVKLQQLFRDKKKNQWLIYAIFIGIFLLCISQVRSSINQMKDKASTTNKNESSNVISSNTPTYNEAENYQKAVEQKLASLLKRMEGIGQVEVMITLKTSKEVILAQDQITEENMTSETDSSGGKRTSTSRKTQENVVVYSSGNSGNSYIIAKEYMPEIEGVLIVAQGVDDKKIFEIHEAVQALFSIESHKIKVLKMGM